MANTLVGLDGGEHYAFAKVKPDNIRSVGSNPCPCGTDPKTVPLSKKYMTIQFSDGPRIPKFNMLYGFLKHATVKFKTCVGCYDKQTKTIGVTMGGSGGGSALIDVPDWKLRKTLACVTWSYTVYKNPAGQWKATMEEPKMGPIQ